MRKGTRLRRRNDGLDTSFRSKDIYNGAELSWDPASLDQMFDSTQMLWNQGPAEDSSSYKLVILQNIDLMREIHRVLTPRQYQIFNYHVVQGYSIIEIASLLNVKQPVISEVWSALLKRLQRDPLFQSLKALVMPGFKRRH